MLMLEDVCFIMALWIRKFGYPNIISHYFLIWNGYEFIMKNIKGYSIFST
jgi:hypothetical protein